MRTACFYIYTRKVSSQNPYNVALPVVSWFVSRIKMHMCVYIYIFICIFMFTVVMF